jgi:hypothetical protein
MECTASAVALRVPVVRRRAGLAVVHRMQHDRVLFVSSCDTQEPHRFLVHPPCRS